jgi:hypothetical protein
MMMPALVVPPLVPSVIPPVVVPVVVVPVVMMPPVMAPVVVSVVVSVVVMPPVMASMVMASVVVPLVVVPVMVSPVVVPGEACLLGVVLDLVDVGARPCIDSDRRGRDRPGGDTGDRTAQQEPTDDRGEHSIAEAPSRPVPHRVDSCRAEMVARFAAGDPAAIWTRRADPATDTPGPPEPEPARFVLSGSSNR